MLGVVAWFAVGSVVSERAAPAVPGESYPLIARSNCRYESGLCDLENSSLKLTLRPVADSPGELELSSTHALDSALLAVGKSMEGSPVLMRAVGSSGRQWRLRLPIRVAGTSAAESVLRLVVTANDSRYFVETSTAFLTGSY